MNTRTNTIASLKAKRDALQEQLNAFSPTSKAARAIELREEITKLNVRIDLHEKKLSRETVIEADTGKVTAEPSAKDAAFEKLRDAYENFTAACGVVGTKRKVIAWFMALFSAVGLGYLIGKMLEVLITSALAATGSMFLAILIYVAGIALSMYAGAKLGGAVYDYIADGVVDKHWQSLKSSVTGFFKPTLVAA